MIVIDTITHHEDGVAATVFRADAGDVRVRFFDVDADATIVVRSGFASVDAAFAEARKLTGVGA
jgi:ethanolamine utilization microcompartment shell protein EutS